MIKTSQMLLDGDEHGPEAAAQVLRLRIFTTMRWFAALGVVVATLVASQVFGIRFPTVPVYVVSALIVVYNYVLFRQVKNLENEHDEAVIIDKARRFSYVHISLDLVALTAILHYTGGVENPFLFIFVFHVIAASIVLRYQTVYLMATAALVLLLGLAGLEYWGVLPHNNMAGFADPALYRESSYILAVAATLATLLYATTFMATAVSGELRKRQREVVLLRETLLEEKEDELEQAAEEMQNLEEGRNRFLRFIGIAAHDLKAPLTAIQGFLWVMLGGFAGEISDKQKNMLERSTRRITELLTLISDLLDIPRIETGQIVQEMKDVSLRKIIRLSLEGQAELAGQKGVSLKVSIPTGLSHVRGSEPRLQQVMTNLISNAISYTAEGDIHVSVTERPVDIMVEVADTGIGIPAEDQDKLFEDFFRASNVDVKGTGLGLSITRRIIEAHKGRIWVESPHGDNAAGARFSFTLPKLTKAKRRQRR